MSVLNRLWKDKMDIYRWEESVVNNVTKSTKKLKHSDVKCHYSKGSLTDAGEGIPVLKKSSTLFCSLETDLLEGDEVIVTQQTGRKITLTIGEGFPYSNHQEFAVKRSDTA